MSDNYKWLIQDHTQSKIDLMDVEFHIPVKYDHEHRKKNLDLVVCMLQKDFNTNITIYEDISKLKSSGVFEYMKNFNCNYLNTRNHNYFHRTKMLNEMAKKSNSKIIVNYDADIIIPPMQMYLAVEAIRNGDDMVYPYDGRFARMERVTWFKELEKRLDIGFVKNTIFNGMKLHDNLHSVGGCILFNRDSFLEGGGENEEFISFGAEDLERYFRFKTLGYKTKRIKGCLYHINHFVGVDSSVKNPYFKQNKQLWDKIKIMNKQELLEYIKQTFKWKIK